MASLKEIKGRIASVNSTLKITSAMKMVASAKLHKAQERIEGMLPYEQRLTHMLTSYLGMGHTLKSPLTEQREGGRTALVVFSSNTSLCGGFNSNVVRRMHDWLHAHSGNDKDKVRIYPVGRKVAEAVQKCGYEAMGDYTNMANKPNYAEAGQLADELTQRFLSGDIDRVELLYHHFKSTASQELVCSTYLPLDIPEEASGNDTDATCTDYIIEPSGEELLGKLLPEVLKIKIYTALLDSNASEHAARSMAMQTATDNANDLIQELTVMYNKGRQQAITNELLDIMGGSATE